MGTFSRWMPPEKSSGTKWAIAVLAALGAGIIWPTFGTPLVLALIALAIATILLALRERVRLRCIASERNGESLCSFVRAFPREGRDAWILRAVYESLIDYLRLGAQSVPLRPSDRLVADWGIDEEDLADMVQDIARRVGRDLQGKDVSVAFSKVATVGDVVVFLQSRPRLAF